MLNGHNRNGQNYICCVFFSFTKLPLIYRLRYRRYRLKDQWKKVLYSNASSHWWSPYLGWSLRLLLQDGINFVTNTASPEQNCSHFANGISTSFYENKVSYSDLSFPKLSSLDNKSSLVQIMSWHQTVNNPLPVPILNPVPCGIYASPSLDAVISSVDTFQNFSRLSMHSIYAYPCYFRGISRSGPVHNLSLQLFQHGIFHTSLSALLPCGTTHEKSGSSCCSISPFANYFNDLNYHTMDLWYKRT